MTTNPRDAESGGDDAARRAVMALCAEASRADLEVALSALDAPAAADLRPAETGLVMATGRIGGDKQSVRLTWPEALKGKVFVTARCDAPT